MMEGGRGWDTFCVVTFGEINAIVVDDGTCVESATWTFDGEDSTREALEEEISRRFWCGGYACYAQETIADEMFGCLR